ncbi:DgyrCDS6125 [Dimorphilus gyrociliatus]|uniref:DgyrCDS6125 n=1 Tax=Dimorphilus gyrociliatus TaxID=2664684 RepID=A0A7I8VMV2_9ANNE|nr:DgyrCDS6125 [Dimorphilus gyrociliatus]
MASFAKVPVIDVHSSNIEELYNSIILAVRSASFVAIDLELSGIGDKRRVNTKDIAERYEAISEGAKTRSVVSLGISCFCRLPSFSKSEEESALRFAIQTFNLFLLCKNNHIIESSSVKFLVQHGFDFNTQYKYGLLYSPGDDTNEDIETDQKSFRNILNEILRCKVPIVFHNALIDIVFLYQSFLCELPKNFSTFIADLDLAFKGGLYDTKYLAAFIDRMQATYLEYCFRKCQSENVKNCDNLKSHVIPTFPAYPSSMSSISFLHCELPRKPVNDTHCVCKRYASFGWCLDAENCKYSHDIDEILAVDFKFDKVRKRKLQENESVDDDRYQPKSTKARSSGHRAGFDSYMTGFVFGFLLSRHGTSWRENPKSKKVEDMGLLEAKNQIYLVGKDFGLQVKKSNFAKVSEACRKKCKRLYGECE